MDLRVMVDDRKRGYSSPFSCLISKLLLYVHYYTIAQRHYLSSIDNSHPHAHPTLGAPAPASMVRTRCAEALVPVKVHVKSQLLGLEGRTKTL